MKNSIKWFCKKSILIMLLELVYQNGFSQNRIKKTDYEYDLISGNVKQVTYQANHPEIFVQQYKYDADNRITEVRSSTDGVIFNRDAVYSYYQHGPLSRTVLGDNSVQGLDYVYTIQGWLKAVNSNLLDPSKDPGKDGQVGSKIARDVFGYSLGYYHDDYTSIGGSMQFLSIITPSDLDATNDQLFNGNIRHMITSLTDNTGTQLNVQGNAYRYDQLNRIKQSEMFVLNKATNSFAGAGPSTMYKENFNYDANGNITGLTRNGNAVTRLMDQLTYKYAEESGKKANNRLLHVSDAAATATYSTDVNDQGPFTANDPLTWNYRYDAIGNMIYDRQSGIEEISWNVGGKIKSIHGIVDSARTDMEFKYDAMGHRIAKIIKPFGHLTDASFWIYTYYVLDVKGNTLAVYEKKAQDGELKIRLKEQYIYGSKRLGSVQRDLDVTDPYLPMPTDTYTFEKVLGKTQYELCNHLGNVLAVISDKRTAHLTGAGVPDYYLAKVSSATDYYAFGNPMPGRDFNSITYRFGFNGMEKDNEVKGNGNSYSTEFRQYDSRLGRWLSLDPKMTEYPNLSPFVAFNNNPVYFDDPFGDAPPQKSLDPNYWKPHQTAVSDAAGGRFANTIAGKGVEFVHPVRGPVTIMPDNLVHIEGNKFVYIESKRTPVSPWTENQTSFREVYNSSATGVVDARLQSPKSVEALSLASDEIQIIGLEKITGADDIDAQIKAIHEKYSSKAGFAKRVNGVLASNSMSAKVRTVAKAGTRAAATVVKTGGKALAVFDVYSTAMFWLWISDPTSSILPDKVGLGAEQFHRTKTGEWVPNEVYEEFGEDWRKNYSGPFTDSNGKYTKYD